MFIKTLKKIISSRIILPAKTRFCAVQNQNDEIPDEHKDISRLIKSIREAGADGMTIAEYYNLSIWVKATKKVPGEMAELGVWRGGSAKIISAISQKPLHLFDTFEGMPDTLTKDDHQWFTQGKFASQMEEVKDFLKTNPRIFFYKGYFPKTAEPIKDKRFSFVHLDADIYQSTLDGLRFFYPRMSKGGMIVSHDYGLSGVHKAFSEFFADKPEAVIEPPYGSTQCMVIKL